jgi:ATP-dependent exoDNAse (exonuclease V) beta subunit
VLSSIADPILRDESGQRSFFCVGDVKQSIYGWRAAEPRLLGEFTKKRPGIREEELRESFRSSAPVLETVNQVFEGIAENPAFVDSDGKERVEAKAAAAEFQKGFVHHVQAKRPGGELPGAVYVVRAAAADEHESKESAALSAAVERARGILEEAPSATIGILTRRRKWIPELIHRLRKKGIHASDEGGNPLTDSVAVLHALSLLHLADHPGDSAAAFHVATSPLGRKVGLTVEDDEGEIAREDEGRTTASSAGSGSGMGAGFGSGRTEAAHPAHAARDVNTIAEQRPPNSEAAGANCGEGEARGPGASTVLGTWPARSAEVARGVRRALAEKGFGGFLASVRPAEGDGYDAWDAGRFGQLVDLALAWEGRAGSRASAFVEHVRKTKVEDPSAAQVRVMTVHGAKGLEFDAVILPELDLALARGEDRLLTLRPDPEGEIEVVTHGARKEVTRAHAELECVRADVAKRRLVEELCVLYVAMTRAIHRLDLIVQRREKEGGGLTYAAILRGALRVEAGKDEGLAWTNAKNSSKWFREELAAAGGSPRANEGRVEKTSDIGSAARTGAAADKELIKRGSRSARPEPTDRDGGLEGSKRTGGGNLRLAPSMRPRSLPGLAPSRAKDMGTVKARDLLRPHDTITARGRILHRFLEEVEWIETFDRSDEELMGIGRTLEANERIVAEAVAEFRAALVRPVTRAVLSKPVGDAEALRERRFAVVTKTALEGEAVWMGTIDRIVITRNGERSGFADIVDFKTDRIEADAVLARAGYYRAQLDVYRRAMQHLLSLEAHSIRVSALFLHHDKLISMR